MYIQVWSYRHFPFIRIIAYCIRKEKVTGHALRWNSLPELKQDFLFGVLDGLVKLKGG